MIFFCLLTFRSQFELIRRLVILILTLPGVYFFFQSDVTESYHEVPTTPLTPITVTLLPLEDHRTSSDSVLVNVDWRNVTSFPSTTVNTLEVSETTTGEGYEQQGSHDYDNQTNHKDHLLQPVNQNICGFKGPRVRRF